MLAGIRVGETWPARSVEFEGMISMHGDVVVRGTIEIAFLLLLAVPTVPPPEKTSALAVPLRSRSLQIVTIVKELRFNISIESGLSRVRSRMSSRSAWMRASPVRSHCESTPA